MAHIAAARASSPALVVPHTWAAEASSPAPVTRTAVPEVPTSDESFQVRYPWHFKGCMAVGLIIAASWVGNYVLVVSPTLEAINSQPCKDGGSVTNDQLAQNAKMILVYFIWFAVARMSLFMTCIASRVTTVHSSSHGFCRTYCVHLIIREGPIYVFVIGCIFFCFHLFLNPYCEHRSGTPDAWNLSMYQTLQIYAIYSCLVSVLSMLLAYWHNKLLLEAARRWPSKKRRAPPGTLEKLETRAYDEALFGDDEETPYSSDCAICLGTWDAEDVIKVTPCGHAFHEECLGGWFRNGRTCAICRQDLTGPPSSSSYLHFFNWRMNSLRPRALGAPVTSAAVATSPLGNATTSSDHAPGNPTVAAEAVAVDEEFDDLGAVANEGSISQPVRAVRRQLANDGQDEGIYAL
eukprot:CAMPEP_0172832684 /NCGR_PEP_ID=MMETSP1075-20121228/23833_1 /TAXON_ID=2916 /ORGANISM="Ceratium fusus, Strain PA161109" /LENGTH=405 /DNA_ID=CAMNT_0013675327 /DNA_START=28 /DNA_END=1245 /DNA_ORIENTATION=-